MIKDGWRLAHAIKTAQSAQLESFNFLHIFEKNYMLKMIIYGIVFYIAYVLFIKKEAYA
jgi:hypothetical protein